MSSLLQFTCYTRGLTNCSSAKRHESFQIHWLCMNTQSVLDACSIKQQSSRFDLNINFFFYRVKLFCSQTPVYSLRYRGTYIRMKETLKPCLISSQKKKKKEQRGKKVNTRELFFFNLQHFQLIWFHIKCYFISHKNNWGEKKRFKAKSFIFSIFICLNFFYGFSGPVPGHGVGQTWVE